MKASDASVQPLWKRILRHCAITILALAILASVVWFASPPLLVAQVRNEQVHWSGQFIGLVPILEGVLPRLIFLRGRACVPHLVRALDDDSRYIAAHVYLTYLSREPRAMSAADFNGLRVDLDSDRTIIPPDQKQAIIAQWNSK